MTEQEKIVDGEKSHLPCQGNSAESSGKHAAKLYQEGNSWPNMKINFFENDLGRNPSSFKRNNRKLTKKTV